MSTPHPDCRATVRRHGTYSAARYGCTCPEAIADRRRYNKLHHHGYNRPRLIDATGTHRRIQALCVLGWSRQDIAEKLGIGERAVGYLLAEHTVTTRTAARVRRVYDELWLHTGPSERTRTHALRQGWVSPLAWDDDTIDDPRARPHGYVAGAVVDEVAVARAVRGERAEGETLSRAERRAAILRCRELGLPAHEIARRVGVSTRTVERVSGPRTPDLSAA